jgi:hypothetical protein
MGSLDHVRSGVVSPEADAGQGGGGGAVQSMLPYGQIFSLMTRPPPQTMLNIFSYFSITSTHAWGTCCMGFQYTIVRNN